MSSFFFSNDKMDEVKNCSTNSSFNNPSDFFFFPPFWAQIVEVSIIAILILFCVVGNSLLCIMLCSNENLKIPANLFCINLSLADLLIGCISLPFWAVATFWQDWHLPMTICSINAFMSIVLITSSTLTLAAISVDRYLCICHPLRYPIFVTHKRICILILSIWILGLILASAPFYGWGEYTFRPQKIPICSSVFSGYVGYSSFLWTVIIFLPITTIVCSYCLILKAVKHQLQRIGTLESQLPQLSSRSDAISRELYGKPYRIIHLFFYRHKSIKTIFPVIGAFFVCWGPYIIVNIWSLSHNTQPISYMANLVTTFFAFSNSSINPILLIAFNKELRSCFYNFISKIRNCHRRLN